jgi:predicted dehydrogenase
MEATCDNLFDWGTHWFDMLFFYNDETPVEWVIGQIEPRGTKTIFGVPVEGQGLSYFGYQNGVQGLLMTGFGAGAQATNRLTGTDGFIEVRLGGEAPVRVWGKGQAVWQEVALPPGEGSLGDVVGRGVLDLIDALKTGREPELSARKALQATELIFATYASSRRRGHVDLPLQIDDSPFLEMLQSQHSVA